MSQNSNTGICPNCQSVNSYSAAACMTCGARLPWADAVDTAKRSAAAQVEAEQSRRLEVAKAEAKAAKEIARTTPITQRQSSPVTAVLAWMIGVAWIGFFAWNFFTSKRIVDENVADQTDEIRQGTTGSGSPLTMSAYNQLRDGMTQSDAIALLGPPSSSTTVEMGGVTTIGLHWTAPDVVISASFQNGRLVLKTETGL